MPGLIERYSTLLEVGDSTSKFLPAQALIEKICWLVNGYKEGEK
jgi:hypothetical protein